MVLPWESWVKGTWAMDSKAAGAMGIRGQVVAPAVVQSLHLGAKGGSGLQALTWERLSVHPGLRPPVHLGTPAV